MSAVNTIIDKTDKSFRDFFMAKDLISKTNQKLLDRVLKDCALTEQQQKFVYYVATLGDFFEAARIAGYSDPAAAVPDLRLSPAVQDALDLYINEALKTSRVIALSVMEEIATNKSQPSNVRLKAANDLADRCGMPRMTEKSNANASKELGEMSKAELESFIAGKISEKEQEYSIDAEVVTPSLSGDKKDSKNK